MKKLIFVVIIFSLFINVVFGEAKYVTVAPTTAGWQTVVKKTSEPLSTSTVFQDDDELFFPVEASGEYEWQAYLFLTTNTTADWKGQFTGPAAPTKVEYAGYYVGGASIQNFGGPAAAFSTSQASTGFSATTNVVTFRGYLLNGSNAGNITLQWAQNASSATTTMERGSYILWHKLN